MTFRSSLSLILLCALSLSPPSSTGLYTDHSCPPMATPVMMPIRTKSSSLFAEALSTRRPTSRPTPSSTSTSINSIFDKTFNLESTMSKSKIRKQDIIEELSSSLPRTKNYSRSASIRIETTKQDHLPTIVDLLSFESASPSKSESGRVGVGGIGLVSPPQLLNWNHRMQKLKDESSFRTQLTQRLATKQAAAKVLSSLSPQESEHYHTHGVTNNQILWSDDTFRSKFENAAKSTSKVENTVWDSYNYALTPDEGMLHHFMISAVDVEFVGNGIGGSGSDGGFDGLMDPEVVGFCEIAICEIPALQSDDDNDDDRQRYAPCIGNLVVSPNHRRRGIGQRLLQNAERLIRLYYRNISSESGGNDDDNNDGEIMATKSILGLYVDEDNSAARRLYQKEGFQTVERFEDSDGDYRGNSSSIARTTATTEARIFMYRQLE